MNNKYFKKNGLSLIESMIALAIVALIVGSLLSVFWQSSMLSRKLDSSIASQGLAYEPLENNFTLTNATNASNAVWPVNYTYNVTLQGNSTANITYVVGFNQTNATAYLNYGSKLRYFNSTVTWTIANKTRSMGISTKKAGY
jgi:prepilin-type N-terminal cleavage/methylation domain-containing protein